MNRKIGSLVVLCMLGLAALLAGCDSGPAATPTPSVNNTPGINITRADLDAARAKWNALNVQDYEATVEYGAFSLLSGKWNLRVVNGKVESKSLERSGTPETPPPDTDLYLLTVDGLFTNIERVLGYGNQQGEDYVFRYEARFDPEKGYPTHFSARSVPNPDTGSVIADADYTIDITSLKVNK